MCFCYMQKRICYQSIYFISIGESFIRFNEMGGGEEGLKILLV